MASASCSETPSNSRRLRAERFNFEAPSFSLGIDSTIFGTFPSFGELVETDSGRDEEKKSCEVTNSGRGEEKKSCEVPNSGRGEEKKSCEVTNSGRGEEEKGCEEKEEIVLDTDSEDDLQLISSQQQRRFKRLKRGPSSAEKKPFEGSGNLSQKLDIFARKRSKDLSESSTQPYKDPLPLVKDLRNRVAEGIHAAGTQSTDFGRGHVRTGTADCALPSAHDDRSWQHRLEPEPLPAREDTLKFGSQREIGNTGGGFSFSREPLPSVHNVRNNPSESIPETSDRYWDEDDIEELSDDERFGLGSRTQRERPSLRPQMSGPSPIILSSSPETTQKSQQNKKPVLHIPRIDSTPKVPARLSSPQEDPFWMKDFVSESGWRRTKPDLNRHAQTPQYSKKFTPDIQGPYSVPSMFKTSQRDPCRETSFNGFDTETPARRDTVGPSQVLRHANVNESEENQRLEFLRQRFPHYKPVDALLVDGGLDNEPVYIDYRRQFAEGRGKTTPLSGNLNVGERSRWPEVRSINEALSGCRPSIPAQRRNAGGNKYKSKSQQKKQNPGKASSSAGGSSRRGKRGRGASGEGKWSTVNGARVYIVGGQKMTGRRAYSVYKKRAGTSSSKKTKKEKPLKARKKDEK